MQKEFVTYEIAKKLKELGFDEPCLAYYAKSESFYDIPNTFFMHPSGIEYENIKGSSFLAPLWQQAIDWFYYNHEILIVQIPSYSMKVWEVSKKGNKDVISGLSINKAIEEALKQF